MLKLVGDYQELKREYFALLSKSNGNKGQVRAYVGGLTAIGERSITDSSGNYMDAHVSAFESAVAKARDIKASSDLRERLQAVRNEWARLQKDDSMGAYASGPIMQPPIRKVGAWRHNGFNAISLFSGAMGLDIGFMAAGFDLRLANDIDARAKQTANTNVPSLEFIHKDVDTVTTDEILRAASVSKGDADVLVGGPPCQPFSPAGKRAGLSDPRASPLKYFLKAINEIRPRAFVMEEVPGVLSSRLKHFPISERSNRGPNADELPGSAFKVILGMLHSTGYGLVYGKLNAADYGAPQVRERIIFIGLRDGTPTLPTPSCSGTGANSIPPWNSFWEATADLRQSPGEFPPLSAKTKGYVNFVPPGGNWRELPVEVTREAMGNAFYAGGGKMGFYRRLAWDSPSPTVVTTPMQKGTMFIHPEINRPISVLEYARVQGFPDDWHIVGSVSDKYRLIGNAVPVYLSYAVAAHVMQLLEGGKAHTGGGLYGYERAGVAVATEPKIVGETKEEKGMVNEQEQELIALVLEESGFFGKAKSRTVSSYFEGLSDFLAAGDRELGSISYVSGRRVLNADDVKNVATVRDIGIIDPGKPLVDNFITVMSRNFIRNQLDRLRGLSLSEMNPNPFLIQSLNLSTPEEVVRFNVYAAVMRSIVTSFGMAVQGMLATTSGSVQKVRSGFDLLKLDKEGRRHWIQVKSGPNDMDKDQVVYWKGEIDKVTAAGDRGYVGITYGKRTNRSVSMGLLKKYLPDWEIKTLVGRELWEFLSDDPGLYARVLEILRTQAVAVLNSSDIMSELDTCVSRVTKEFLSSYGDGPEGVKKYVEDIF